jgi:hypothetical protein
MFMTIGLSGASILTVGLQPVMNAPPVSERNATRQTAGLFIACFLLLKGFVAINQYRNSSIAIQTIAQTTIKLVKDILVRVKARRHLRLPARFK